MSWIKKLGQGLKIAGGLSQFVPGVGTLVGAGLGIGGTLLANRLGRGGGNEAAVPGQQLQNVRQQIIEQLAGRGGLTEQPGYRAGVGMLNNLLEEQTAADQARLAQLGMGGSEMEIAQNAVRGQNYGRGLLGMLQGAEQSRMQGLGLALDAQGMEDANYWRAKQLKENKRGQILGALGSAVGSLATAYAMKGAGKN